MVLFQNAIIEAIQEIQALPDYSVINEVTIIRDVHGRLSFLLSSTKAIDKARAKENLRC